MRYFGFQIVELCRLLYGRVEVLGPLGLKSRDSGLRNLPGLWMGMGQWIEETISRSPKPENKK